MCFGFSVSGLPGLWTSYNLVVWSILPSGLAWLLGFLGFLVFEILAFWLLGFGFLGFLVFRFLGFLASGLLTTSWLGGRTSE